MKKTLKEYAQLVLDHKDQPSYLADINVELASNYAFLAEDMKELQVIKAGFWLDKKFENIEKPLSDKSVEYEWLRTTDGTKEIRLKWTLKGYDKLMSSIKSNNIISTIEARNVM